MRVLVSCAEAGRPDLAYPGARSLLNVIPEGAKCPQAAVRAFSELMQRSGRWASSIGGPAEDRRLRTENS